MVKGKGKGSEALEALLGDRSYKNAIYNVIKDSPVLPGDFDQKAVLLLDWYEESGRAGDACQHLQSSLKGMNNRSKISNWRAYVYTLLRGFDEALYSAMKESKGQENRKKRRSERKAAEAEAAAAAEAERKDAPEQPLPQGTPVGLLLSQVLASKDASSEKPKFNEEAAEFVPGKLWDAPPDPKPKRELREGAVEFVPTQQFMPNMSAMGASTSFKPSAAEFQPGQIAWTGALKADASSSSSTKPLKQTAAEFIPGVSAWMGAVPKAKAKAKGKAKASAATPKAAKAAPSTPQPERPGPISRGQSGHEVKATGSTKDADIAAGSASAKAKASPPAASTAPMPKPVGSAAGAVSETCRKALANAPEPFKAKTEGDCLLALAGAFSPAECQALLESAQGLGFRPAEQDRAGGSRLLTEDAWLASELWRRVSTYLPLSFQDRMLTGLKEKLEFQYGRQEALESDKLVLQLCLKPAASNDSSMPQIGELRIVRADAKAGPAGITLCAELCCGDMSALDVLQRSLGFGGPASERRQRMLGVSVFFMAAASVAMPLLARRRR